MTRMRMTRRRAIFGILLLLLLVALLVEVSDRASEDSTPPSPPSGSDRESDRVAGAGSSAETPAVPVGTGPGEDDAPGASGEAGGDGPAPGMGEARGKDEAGAERPGDLPPGYYPEFSGRVVDLVTGKPIAKARVIYGPFPNWTGATTDDGGRFGYRLGKSARPYMVIREHLDAAKARLAALEEGDWRRQRAQGAVESLERELAATRVPAGARGHDPAVPYRIRVTAPGYETFEVVPGEAELEIVMRPVERPPVPGRITGRLEDRDGRPYQGVATVVLRKGGTDVGWFAVLADEQGRFVLEGVEAGAWRIWFGGGEPADAYVPEGGEADVVVRAKRTADRLRPRHRDERIRVRVTGLDGKDGLVLVAEFYGPATERWRAVISAGSASFPALFPGKWTLKLIDPVGKPRDVMVVVPEGADPAVVRFSSAPR
jgi:hypothetical protein